MTVHIQQREKDSRERGRDKERERADAAGRRRGRAERRRGDGAYTVMQCHICRASLTIEPLQTPIHPMMKSTPRMATAKAVLPTKSPRLSIPHRPQRTHHPTRLPPTPRPRTDSTRGTGRGHVRLGDGAWVVTNTLEIAIFATTRWGRASIDRASSPAFETAANCRLATPRNRRSPPMEIRSRMGSRVVPSTCTRNEPA